MSKTGSEQQAGCEKPPGRGGGPTSLEEALALFVPVMAASGVAFRE